MQLLPNFHRTISQSSPNGAKQQKHRSVFHLCTRQFRHRPLYRYLQNESTHVFNQSRQEKKNDKFLQSDKSHMQVLEKRLGIDTAKMGASDFCILDKDGKIIIQTDWETDNNEYFRLLDECLNRLWNRVDINKENNNTPTRVKKLCLVLSNEVYQKMIVSKKRGNLCPATPLYKRSNLDY